MLSTMFIPFVGSHYVSTCRLATSHFINGFITWHCLFFTFRLGYSNSFCWLISANHECWLGLNSDVLSVLCSQWTFVKSPDCAKKAQLPRLGPKIPDLGGGKPSTGIAVTVTVQYKSYSMTQRDAKRESCAKSPSGPTRSARAIWAKGWWMSCVAVSQCGGERLSSSGVRY